MKWEDIQIGQRVRFLQDRPFVGGSTTIVGFSGKVIYIDKNSVQLSGLGRIHRAEGWTYELIDESVDARIARIQERAESLPDGPI